GQLAKAAPHAARCRRRGADGRGRAVNRRQFLRLALGSAPLLLGLGAAHEAYSFELPRERRVIRGLRSRLRLTLLTDLHIGPYMGRHQLAEWVEASNELEPDLVVLGGDLVDQMYQGDLSEFRELLPAFESRLGVVAVLGNHDRTRFRDLSPLLAALRDSGVTLLRNGGVQLRDDLYLAGIDDWRTGDPDVARALAAAPTGPDAGARVLVSHNPDAIPDLPEGIDLVLAGHTHGGQVRLPLI